MTRSILAPILVITSALLPIQADAQAALTPTVGVSASTLRDDCRKRDRAKIDRPSSLGVGREQIPWVAAAAPGKRHPLRYVLVGAAVGGVALGAAEVAYLARCDDCFFRGPAVAVSVAAGALAGAALGGIVYAVRR